MTAFQRMLVVLVVLIGVAGPRAAGAQGQTPSPFLRGVPSGPSTTETLSLSIGDVITRALQHNLGILMAGQDVERRRALRVQAQSDFLPTIDGRVSEVRQQVNLKAFGFPLPAGFPSLVGPFNVFDARLYLTQTVFDLQALNDLRAERHNVAAAEYSQQSARDLVVLVAANTYLQTLAAAARAQTALAQVATAEAMHMQAVDLRQNGLVPGIDVLRAEVQLGTERQRATAARNDFEKSRLQLARLVGLPIGQAFTLSDQLPTLTTPEIPIEEALERAYKNRPDYQAALARVRAAEATRQAIAGERLPTAAVNADFGDIGLSPADSHSTYSVMGAVKIPIFGGETSGKLAEADVDVRNRRAEAEDVKAGIYYDLRGAYLDLEATREELQVATTGRDLAARQLTQARDRFGAGIADNIEVVQAQDAVARANNQYIAALYGYNLARGLLARGIGGAEETLRQLLGGTR